MKDLSTVDYFEPVVKITDALKKKTQTTDSEFFHILVSYYLSKVASMMRCNINTQDRGIIPVNMYALNLASSGRGKGHSTTVIEEEVINGFRNAFINETLPVLSDKNLHHLGNIKAMKSKQSPQYEFEAMEAEYSATGEFAFSFDSGTTAAVKQMRTKLLLAGVGSMNLEVDEIGSNLLGQIDILTAFLELYDVGKIKQKLIKNTKESIRTQDLEGRTPANMMLYGTPIKLLDGGKTEDEFYSMLGTGYARRCIFGYTVGSGKDLTMTPQDVLDSFKDKSSDAYLETFSEYLMRLADPANFNKELQMADVVSLLSIEYRLECEKQAEELPEYMEVQKAEMSHRYFKALKLAGTYAFIDMATEIHEDHLYSAIKLVEDSGRAFDKILTRDRSYVRLARYIAESKKELTHADIQEDMPFYKGSEAHRRELMNLAIAWGYKNNVIIKKGYADDIEFISGEALEETDIDELILSYSTNITRNYENVKVEWHQMHKLTQAEGHHFVIHHLLDE